MIIMINGPAKLISRKENLELDLLLNRWRSRDKSFAPSFATRGFKVRRPVYTCVAYLKAFSV